MKTYTLSEDGNSITCALCGMRSYNPSDIKHKYCGACNVFHEDLPEAARKLLTHRSFWRRYCDWFEALTRPTQGTALLILIVLAAYCIYDFIRTVFL